MTTTRKTAKKATKAANQQPSDVIMSIRLEASMHERLRKLAFDKRESMRDFIVRGIEEVLRAEKY